MGRKIIALFLVFSYIYQASYIFLPLNFTCTIGIASFLLYFFNKKNFAIGRGNSKSLFNVLRLLAPVALVAILSIFLNFSSDLYFFKWAVINMFYAFGAYFIVQYIIKAYGSFDFHLIVKLLTYCAAIQCTLSLLMFLNPDLNFFLQSLIKQDEIGAEAVESVGEIRMLGFGTYFFGAGLTHGFILLLMALEICNPRLSTKELSLYFILYLYITVVSMLMSRTTMIGAGMGLALIVLYKLRSFQSFFKFAFGIVATLLCAILLIKLIPSSVLGEYEDITKFGFEMFINYKESGELTTVSTNHMFEDMVVFPTDIKTWVIGDALWMDPTGDGYYMHTDIGYCKLLFYFGIIGTIVYFFFQACYIRNVFPFSTYGIIPFLAFFGYVLAINVKGLCDSFPYLMFCYICRYSYVDFPKLRRYR